MTVESTSSVNINPHLIIKRSVPTNSEETLIYLKGEIPQAGIAFDVTCKLTICGKPITVLVATTFE